MRKVIIMSPKKSNKYFATWEMIKEDPENFRENERGFIIFFLYERVMYGYEEEGTIVAEKIGGKWELTHNTSDSLKSYIICRKMDIERMERLNSNNVIDKR
jgi:hypothetical protein